MVSGLGDVELGWVVWGRREAVLAAAWAWAAPGGQHRSEEGTGYGASSVFIITGLTQGWHHLSALPTPSLHAPSLYLLELRNAVPTGLNISHCFFQKTPLSLGYGYRDGGLWLTLDLGYLLGSLSGCSFASPL